MSEFILPLSDPDATLENVGGKGMSLAKLSRAGLPVPGGFHVRTEAYRRFVADNGLQPHILEMLQGVDATQSASLDSASRLIRELFTSAHTPEAIAGAISSAYADLKEPAVAVRSSATAEDLPDASFAGQQETYLNILGSQAVLDAVKNCWASLWTARAIGYRFKNGIDQEIVSLAVVVQELVPAESAGVMFTANPVNGRRDEVIINAAWGLGEAVVSGVVTPDAMTVAKSTGHLIQRVTASKQVMTVRTDTGTREKPVPNSRKKVPVLSEAKAAELSRYGTRIETLYGTPMDIEWAFAGGKFAILQARPVTALPEMQPESTMEWSLPDPKGIYMRASIIEQFPEPLTPLFSSLAGPIINEKERHLFAWLAGVKEMDPKIRLFETINGYGYMNINFGVWNTFLIGLAQVLKINTMFKLSEPRWRQAHDHYLEVIRQWQAKPLAEYRAVELLEGARALTAETVQMYTVLQTGPVATALGSETLFTQVYNRLIRKKGDPDAPVFLMGFESMPVRAEQSLYDLAEWAQANLGLVIHLTSTPGEVLAVEMESATPPAGLDPQVWGEWLRRFREHLDKYGHFTYDLDFSKAVAADNLTLMLETCRMHLLGKAVSPYTRIQALASKREQAVQTMKKRLHGPLLWIFASQLKSAQKYAPLREDGLSDLGLGYPLLRKLLLELGSRLVRANAIERSEDVFWLIEQEACELAGRLDRGEPLAIILPVIRDRQAVWKVTQKLSPPVILPVGSKYMGMDVEKMTSGGVSADGQVIKGFGSSQGRATGTARVLYGPQDFNQMHPGDVLVAPITTPAWTPLFGMALAIVTDIGGPLSHSSIVAREYGIPAVLGTGVATRRIHSGQTITVDGGAGTVTCE